MSADVQRVSAVVRKVAKARGDRQVGVAPARNDVKSSLSYRILDHTSNAKLRGERSESA